MLNNKVAIVTGASQGLGKSIVDRLVIQGTKVIGIARSEEKMKIIKDQYGDKFSYFVADLSNTQDLDSVYDKILSKHKTIDILINNAAIRHEGSVLDHDTAILKRLLLTNVFGVMGSIYKVYPHMKAAQKGQILVVNSTAGVDVCKDRSPYAGSKFALTGYVKGLYEEAALEGIKVMQIHPGGMDTNIFENFKEGYGKHDRMMNKDKVADIVIDMLSQPDDMIIDSLVVRKFGKV